MERWWCLGKYLIVNVIMAWGFTSLKKLDSLNECSELISAEKVVIIIHLRFLMCMIKIFWGAGVVTPSKPPSPTNNFCLYPPCFKMFLERSLNDPHPHHPTSSIFHCYPSHHPPPLPPPSPLKILIIHNLWVEVFRRIKIRFIIITYKLVDFIEVIRIKIVTLNAEVSFNRFGKELRLISVSLGGFRIKTQSRKIALTLWLEEVFNFTPRLSMASL